MPHSDCTPRPRRAWQRPSPPLLLSPFVLAELDLLLATRVGLAARILASRHKIQDVLTLDQRHLRALAANDRPFRLLPGDN